MPHKLNHVKDCFAITFLNVMSLNSCILVIDKFHNLFGIMPHRLDHDKDCFVIDDW